VILTLAILFGLAISLARHRGQVLGVLSRLPLRAPWLALIAVGLQVPLLRAEGGTPGEVAAQQVLFLASHLPLLAFVWLNRRLPGLWLVGLGATCNLLVVAANGGWMPIEPETLARINPGSAVSSWPTGLHYHFSKDIILSRGATHLWWLSDILVIPAPFPWPAACSAGDVLIAAGLVVLLQGAKNGSVKGARQDETQKSESARMCGDGGSPLLRDAAARPGERGDGGVPGPRVSADAGGT